MNPPFKKTGKKNLIKLYSKKKKALNRVRQPFLERSGIQGVYIIKAIYSKPKVNIKLNGEKFKVVPLKSGTGHQKFK